LLKGEPNEQDVQRWDTRKEAQGVEVSYLFSVTTDSVAFSFQQEEERIEGEGSKNNSWPFFETFEEPFLPDQFKSVMISKGFSAPTLVQAQAWPLSLMGEDMVVLSQTGRYV
jgi:superfamily II DNA/RNA helicase